MGKKSILLRKKPTTSYIAEVVVENVYRPYQQIDENIGAVGVEI